MADDETRKAAREAIEAVARKRRELGIAEPPREPVLKPPDFTSAIPHWVSRFEKLDETSHAAWDERLRRIAAGTATSEDWRVQEAARRALETGSTFPAEAMRMPGPELDLDERTWHPEAPTNPERAVSIGIPPLIAGRIARNETRETRSTRACSRVGRDYLILVLIGDVGCGKTYAAAHWLWTAKHVAPSSIRRRVKPRRFIESAMLTEIPFAQRAELGEAIALVVDDCGAEKDFLRQDLATIFVQRYSNALPTVLTTNLSEPDFVAMYGGRFADRMKEVGRFVTVSNSAEDSLRGKD